MKQSHLHPSISTTDHKTDLHDDSFKAIGSRKPAGNTSPIQELPYDILAEIFSHAVSKPVEFPDGNSQGPLDLVQVCSSWRHVALEMPSLWNSISLDFQSDLDYCVPLTKIAELFFARAGRSLISLTIEADGLELPHDASWVITSFVQPYVGQLRHLSLHPAVEFPDLLGLRPGRMNQLESLHLSVCSPHIIRAFDGASNLRTASIVTDYDHLYPQDLHLPWAKLTSLHFKLTTLSFVGCHAVLRQCTSLVSLALGIVPNDDCHAPQSDTLLPCLESLMVFTFDEDAEYGQFLQPLVLPSLKHLEIESHEEAIWPDEGPPVLKPRCLHNLESLKIAHLGPSAALVFLHDAPSLVELSLCSLEDDESLDDLVTAISSGDVAPKLRMIECDIAIVDSLVGILEERAKVSAHEESPYATIESVVVRGKLEDAPDVRESLAQLRSQGLNIVFEDQEI
jgi:F-box-like